MSPVPNSAEFQLRPSFYYLCARLGLVAIAAGLIAVLPLLTWAKLAALLCLGLAAGWFFVNYRGQGAEKLIVLDASEDRWRLMSASGAVELLLDANPVRYSPSGDRVFQDAPGAADCSGAS